MCATRSRDHPACKTQDVPLSGMNDSVAFPAERYQVLLGIVPELASRCNVVDF
jgi:hypothetical protein